MALDKINSYVKFIKGSIVAWEQLPIERRKSDTLYFITEYAKDESGKQLFDQPLNTSLYLGNVLVSDGKETTILPEDLNLKLDHLIDVNTNYTLNDKMVLAYDSQSEQWIPQSIDTITTDIDDFTGATSAAGGVAGLVPAPAAGDEKKVLTGDGNWTELNIPNTSDLETQMATLIGTDKNLSIREIAANELAIQLIPENAAESLNELKEIATWIQEHPEDASAMNLAIQDLENAVFDKIPRVDEEGNPVLDGTTGEQIIDKVSKVGNLEEILQKAQEDILSTSTEVGQLETLLGAQKDEDGNLTGLTAVDKITAIETALGLEKDEESGSIIITSAPIGKLEELLLVKNAQEGEEVPTNLVEAINMLTEQMTWGELPE